MKTRTVLVVSGLGWCAVAAYNDLAVGVPVIIYGHYLFWHLHRVEVKLNRLLDHIQIRVTEAEMAE